MWHLPRDFLKRYLAHDYTVEVRNRFKGLNLIDRVPEELWVEVHDIVQETGIKTIPWKRNAKKQNGCLGKRVLISWLQSPSAVIVEP